MRRYALAWVVTCACGAAAPPVPPPVAPPPRAAIHITSTTCPDPGRATAGLVAVLAAHGAVESDLIVEVLATPGAVHLIVLRSGGDVGLDRRYALGPADCESAADLLALGVDRFLSAFPEWAGPAPRRETTTPPPRRHDLALTAGLHGLVAPVGGELQLGVRGGRGPLVALLQVRATVPQAAGAGRFQQTAVLGGVGWRRRAARWELRGEARAGGIVVSGIGFDENHASWLPWWELAAGAARRTGWGSIGLEIAGSALQHRAVTADRLVEEDLAWLRFGLTGTLDVFP